MLIHRTYFSKSNTIQYQNITNTGKSPYTELYFGNILNVTNNVGFSRFIFDLDLADITSKIEDIPLDCNTSTHILKMINTSSFDRELLNKNWSNGKKRATSFDLLLYRITDDIDWDEGVGSDFVSELALENDKSFSNRPSNWFNSTTVNTWSTPGVLNNNSVLIGQQHFSDGNENLEIDMTSEINAILSNQITKPSGWMIVFREELENVSNLTENYAVGFYTRHTQTFYKPVLESKINNTINDNRNNFTLGVDNNLYLYVSQNGQQINLDEEPTVTIIDNKGDNVTHNGFLCKKGLGIYEYKITSIEATKTPCLYHDVWGNIKINNNNFDDIKKTFLIENKIDFNNDNLKVPNLSIKYTGINNAEKIIRGDIRKVIFNVFEKYTTNKIVDVVNIFYKLYVKEGKTQVLVNDWTILNKERNNYYFILDTSDKLPNDYYLDFKYSLNGIEKMHDNTIKFTITDTK